MVAHPRLDWISSRSAHEALVFPKPVALMMPVTGR